ncbi:hypothetical protein ACLX1H_007923 [Fusarium chlamydosporum]
MPLRRRSLQPPSDYYRDRDLPLTAETIKKALKPLARNSILAREAFAFELDPDIHSDLNTVRLAAFGCKLLLRAHIAGRCDDGFNSRYITAELPLPRGLLTVPERDFLKTIDRGYYTYWLILLAEQVNHTINAFNSRVTVIDMRPPSQRTSLN